MGLNVRTAHTGLSLDTERRQTPAFRNTVANTPHDVACGLEFDFKALQNNKVLFHVVFFFHDSLHRRYFQKDFGFFLQYCLDYCPFLKQIMQHKTTL